MPKTILRGSVKLSLDGIIHTSLRYPLPDHKPLSRSEMRVSVPVLGNGLVCVDLYQTYILDSRFSYTDLQAHVSTEDFSNKQEEMQFSFYPEIN